MFKTMNGNLKRLVATFLMGALMLTGNGFVAGGVLNALLSPSLPAYAEGVKAVEIVDKQRETTTAMTEEDEKYKAMWDELVEQYGPDVDWPLEVWAEYSQRVVEMRVVRPDWIHGLPAAEDIQRDEAVEIAKAHLLETMGFKEDMWKRFKTSVNFIVTDPEKPYYRVIIYPAKAEEYAEIGSYLCYLDGRSGEITEFLTPADAVG